MKEEGVTALMLAAATGNMEMLRLLIEGGANPALHTAVGAISNCGEFGGP